MSGGKVILETDFYLSIATSWPTNQISNGLCLLVVSDTRLMASTADVAAPTGSSNGRGPRCAAWFRDYARSVGDEDMQVMVLEGGVKGWVRGGTQFTRLMEGYDEAYWTKLLSEEEQTVVQPSK